MCIRMYNHVYSTLFKPQKYIDLMSNTRDLNVTYNTKLRSTIIIYTLYIAPNFREHNFRVAYRIDTSYIIIAERLSARLMIAQ